MEYVVTKLTNHEADSFFNRGGRFLNPVLEAMLRYIALKHHDGSPEKVQLINCGRSELYAAVDEDFLESLEPRTLHVFTVRRGYELPSCTVTDWESMDTPPFPVAPFLSKASETRVYYNKNEQKIALFVKNITDRWVDLLCSTLCRILFWIYASDEDISTEEVELFKLFVQKKPNAERFREIIDAFADKYDFKRAFLKKMLIGWNKETVESQIRREENSANQCRNNIYDYERELAKQYTFLDGYLKKIAALRATAPEEDDSMYKFFDSRKQLSLWKIQNNGYDTSIKSLYFSITDTIEYFDEEAFKRAFESRNSFIPHDNQDIRDILWGLFALTKGAIRVESVFRLDNLSALVVERNVRCGSFESTHAPQPHQYFYGCLGGNEMPINKYMSEGNWDMAIDQAIAAAKNLNFGDYTVCSRLVLWMREHMDTVKCIVADNGEEMTLRQFAEYVRACAADGQSASVENVESTEEPANE